VSRYLVEPASGFGRLVWRIRARLVDSENGESLEVGKREIAEHISVVLERADAGELAQLPLGSSPFRRYETSGDLNGWYYLSRAEGALDHGYFARTKSEQLARRVAEALNRDDPRRLRDPHGPPKMRWF
jgi:hypothetical protein